MGIALEEYRMNKRVCFLAATLVALILTGSACSLYAPVLNTISTIPTLAPGPTLQRVTAGVPDSQPTSSGKGALQPAPLCEVGTSCQAFDAVQIPVDCVKKVPYTNVLVPIGTKFGVVDTSGDFTCVDTDVVVNGKEVISCHGRQLYSFELKLTNAACTDGNLSLNTGQCQDGYGYNAEHQCCAAIPSGAEGSITVRVSLGACPVPSP
jgi:hypothetical protein